MALVLESAYLVQIFHTQDHKKGWKYILIPGEDAQIMGHNTRLSFRIKGYIGTMPANQVALLPDGSGNFILPINAKILRETGVRAGEKLKIKIEIDQSEKIINEDLLDSISFSEIAETFFNSLSKSHQTYFSKYVSEAKTIETKTKRITQCMFGLENHMDYGQMIRHFKQKNN